MKRKTEFKPVKLCLKIDFVSHPACAEGFGNNTYNLLSLRIRSIVWIVFKVFKLKYDLSSGKFDAKKVTISNNHHKNKLVLKCLILTSGL